MEYKLLDGISSPHDLKELPAGQMESLCGEIREFLLDRVTKSGGHLASNLGVVELSVALHRVFDSPTDHIIFDVGHQSYVHKLLTGRRERFGELRVPGGLSGFTLMRESQHDAFGAGHSSTSISAALGYAEADRLKGSKAHTVCVIGDGAYTGGMVHEAINNCRPDLRLVIVLNENGMSISGNKGSFASYLSGVRSSTRYINAKRRTGNFLHRLPLVGKPIKWLLSTGKNCLKRIFFHPNYFEELGFYYIGPIDGNDYARVERALEAAKSLNKCVIVHLKTTKGKGFAEAERCPDVYHSVSSTGGSGMTYHEVFADRLNTLAERDDKILAVTPAMGIGTGLDKFEEKYPERYFDVGIAEEHALTFSAGLAADGYKPFCAIYSTFLQRGYDNIVHDIALQGLPVRMIIDRAGIAAADGATHHGIFDVAFLSHIPGVEIISPASYVSLCAHLDCAAEATSAVAIRYPNASECERVVEHFYRDYSGASPYLCDFDPASPPERLFVTYGQLSSRVLRAKEMLAERGIDVGILLVEQIKPYAPTVDFLRSVLTEKTHVVYAEEGIKNGGAAMITESMLVEAGAAFASYRIAAIDDDFVSPTALCDIYEYAGLSSEKLTSYFAQ